MLTQGWVRNDKELKTFIALPDSQLSNDALDDVIMEIFKWLILKNVIVQQHTVSKI